MRLVHLADPHLSHLDDVRLSSLWGKRWSGYLSWHKNRRKKHLAAVLHGLTRAVRAESADQVLLSGDLVQIGLETEILQAAEWLAALGSPERVMLVPGNHDVYARGSAAAVYRSWAGYLFGPGASGATGRFPVVRRLGELTVIGVSTACVTPVFLARGRLGREQLRELAELLAQAAEERRLVCLLIHHPPLPGMAAWRKALADAGALQAVLGVHPPALTLHGHLHHNRDLQWGNARVYCTASASSLIDASYRVIDIEDRCDHWALDMCLKSVSTATADAPRFVAVERQAWRLPKAAG